MKKILIAGFIAGAMAIGTASASHLGNVNDVTIASTTIDVDDCELVDVDFQVGQQLSSGNPTPVPEYYVQGIEFEVTSACDGETLDLRLLGNSYANLHGEFNIPITGTSFTVGGTPGDLGKQLVKDVEFLTVAIH